jgi:type III restriction enzyme
VRAFGTQLLCEQVVGRGLRRRSYAVNDEGYFEPEYANVYGIPFAFIPSDRATKESLPRPPAIMVQSVPGREKYRIEFPKLQGYRTEMADLPLIFEPDVAVRFVVGPSTVPTRTDLAGIVGAGERIDDGVADLRTQRVAFELAKRVLHRHLTGLSEDDRMIWHFAQLTRIAHEWLDTCVDYAPGYSAGNLLAADAKLAEAAEAIHLAIARTEDGQSRLRPMLRAFDSVGDTSGVSFATHKVVEPTEKSEVSHVVLDGIGGNTWEQLLANACERDPGVAAYVKNDHLGFSIPYVHKGRTHAYVPDFLLRLAQREGDVVRTLIVEVSGKQKSPGPTREKAATARDRWCVAVNNAHTYGRWGYVEFTSMDGIRERLADAIAALYADAPITGDPDLLDYLETETDRAAS